MKLGLLVCLCFCLFHRYPLCSWPFQTVLYPLSREASGRRLVLLATTVSPLNEGRTQGGTFHLVNVPQTYKKGVTYSDHCLDRPTRSIPMGI